MAARVAGRACRRCSARGGSLAPWQILNPRVAQMLKSLLTVAALIDHPSIEAADVPFGLGVSATRMKRACPVRARGVLDGPTIPPGRGSGPVKAGRRRAAKGGPPVGRSYEVGSWNSRPMIRRLRTHRCQKAFSQLSHLARCLLIKRGPVTLKRDQTNWNGGTSMTRRTQWAVGMLSVALCWGFGTGLAAAVPSLSFDNPTVDGGTISYGGAGGAVTATGVIFQQVIGVDTPLNSGTVLFCSPGNCLLDFTTGSNLHVEGPPT